MKSVMQVLRELQEQWSALLPPCQVEGGKEGEVTRLVLGDQGELDENGRPHGEVGILMYFAILTIFWLGGEAGTYICFFKNRKIVAYFQHS